MSRIRESKSRYAVLGALSIEPMSGYDIKEVLTKSVGHFWNESYGQIYPTLKELAGEGLVTSRKVAGTGKPDRYIFTLTAAGWSELRSWLTRAVESQQPGRNELLLKLFFGRHAGTRTNVDHLRRHRQFLADRLAQYEAIEAELNTEAEDPDQPYWLITLRHGQLVARASLAWCDETLTRLSEMEAPHGPGQSTQISHG